MPRSRAGGRGRLWPFRALIALVAAALGATLACAGTEVGETFHPRAGGPYRPGESIASARLCTCSVCEERSCCEGDESLSAERQPEFGLALAAPCQCLRRVWTARGEEPCGALAGPDCCPGSVSN
jgi:hypothetical protein